MEIYISRDGQQLGPYTPDDVANHIKTGDLKRDDLAWCEGCAEWMPLTQIPGLKLPGATPPPPPPAAGIVPPPPPPGAGQAHASVGSGLQTTGTLGTVAILIPIGGSILNFFWVGNMNLLQGPESSLNLIAAFVVIGTAALIAIEAGQLGMGNAETDQRIGKKTTSPMAWAVGTILLWIVFFPLYFRDRARCGMKNWFVGAISVSLVYLASFVSVAWAIEQAKDGIRNLFR